MYNFNTSLVIIYVEKTMSHNKINRDKVVIKESWTFFMHNFNTYLIKIY